ncbi:MAG: glucose 1-dehydrogenase [Chloroflexi bacterium]|nr:glucose 1-dehydrogenase [Chloroflexota bacterium]
MKTAIVTGAGQGIGRAIALRLARDGFAVALADINPAALSTVRGEIESAGGKAIGVEVDLSQVAEIQRLVKQTVAELGQLDALVNNAGRLITKPFLDVTEADWDALLELDLKTVFFAMQATARHMIDSGVKGRIVSISSVSGRGGRPDQTPYAAAKAGVISLTRSAALAFASFGITVNAVCPGVVDTPLTRKIHEDRAQALGITPEESLARMIARIPLGRIESPDDIAGAVSFLCSPDAAYITGQALNVCGGMEMD